MTRKSSARFGLHQPEEYFDRMDEMINILTGNEEVGFASRPETLPEMIALLPYEKNKEIGYDIQAKFILLQKTVYELNQLIEAHINYRKNKR